MKIKDIMHSNLVTVDYNDTIKNASNIYRDKKVGCLIVKDGDEIKGIVTERDLIERTICQDKDPNSTPVKDIMTSDVITIDYFDEIDDALEIFKAKNIKKLPVVKDEELVGIITITDLALTRPSKSQYFDFGKN